MPEIGRQDVSKVAQPKSINGNSKTEKRQSGQQQQHEFPKRRRSLPRQTKPSPVDPVKSASVPVTVAVVPTSLSCSGVIPDMSMVSKEMEF